METKVQEVAAGIYRLSTFVSQIAPPAGFTFNQFLALGDDALLFHCGPRWMFPLVSEAVKRVVPLARLRWITFGHVESDECGAMNQWLAAAPQAQVAHGALGCEISINDLADRPPRALKEAEGIDLGGKVLRFIGTPHVPHNWEAGLYFEETTGTLLAGDLLTHVGDGPALTDKDVVGPALAAEAMFHATCLSPATAPTLESLAKLNPRTLALMHGSSVTGDCAAALRGLGAGYERLRLG